MNMEGRDTAGDEGPHGHQESVEGLMVSNFYYYFKVNHNELFVNFHNAHIKRGMYQYYYTCVRIAFLHYGYNQNGDR